MGPPSYIWFLVNWNVVMGHMIIFPLSTWSCSYNTLLSGLQYFAFGHARPLLNLLCLLGTFFSWLFIKNLPSFSHLYFGSKSIFQLLQEGTCDTSQICFVIFLRVIITFFIASCFFHKLIENGNFTCVIILSQTSSRFSNIYGYEIKFGGINTS